MSPVWAFVISPLLILASRHGGVCREEKAKLHQFLKQIREHLLCWVLVL